MMYLLNKLFHSFCLVFLGLQVVSARPLVRNDSLEVVRIYQITRDMISGSSESKIDTLLYYAGKGINLAQKNNMREIIVDFNMNIALAYKAGKDYKNAARYALEAYKEALRLNYAEGIARSGYTHATLCFDAGAIKASLQQISENLKFARENQMKKALYVNYHLLSYITSFTNNSLITDYYAEKAFQYTNDTTLSHTFTLKVRLKNAIIKGHNEEKLYYEFRNRVIKNKTEPALDEIAFLVDIANTYRKSGQAQKAIAIFEELATANIKESLFPENAFYAGMAAAYLKGNQLKKAEILNQEANKNISLLYNYNEYITILETDAIIKEKKGLPLEAIKAWKEIYRIDDSLSNKRDEINYLLVTQLKNLESLENKFESINRENAMQRQLLEKEKRQKILLLSLVLILIIFSLAVYILFRKLKVRNRKILKQNKAISRQTESLRESNQIKDKLFSLLSHELRSPVAELITILDVNEWKNKDSALNPYFKSVNLKAKAIYNTLDNILTWSASQLKFRKTDLKPMNLREIIHKALEINLPYIRQKNIRITNEVRDAVVEANESYLMIIFRNVLNNATKFTLAQGEIRLYSVEEGDYSGIVVQDSGIGMDPETLKSLFVSTQTSAEGTEGEKGSGVGLVLCKDLMDKLQGKVEVSSRINQGTSVKLLFKKEGLHLFLGDRDVS